MRSRTFLVASVMAVATIAPAAPAQAQSWPLDCLESDRLPPLQSIVRDSEGVHIYPDLVDEDVAMLTAEAREEVDRAFCLENGIVTDYLFCLADKALEIANSLDPASGELRYVAYDGGLHVRYPLLLEDVLACVPESIPL
jgi:hypothetical protein